MFTQWLDGGSGRTLAAAAVGLGDMTGAHVKDPFFWLAADAARLKPGRGLLLVTLGTVVQGLAGLAVLALLGMASS